jgi:protein TonB
MVTEKEAPPSAGFGVAGMGDSGGSAGGVIGGVFGNSAPAPIVKAATPKKIAISQGVAQGNLISKTQPIYPPIAKAARVSGTVVLHATISKTGTIENLQVVSGNAMLQQAALEAVRNWRYKPYLLNGEPVEVDTTVNVVFNLGG